MDKDQEMENNKTFYTVDINIDFWDFSIFYELVILDINSMILYYIVQYHNWHNFYQPASAGVDS